mgnify:CR=1 FL=1
MKKLRTFMFNNVYIGSSAKIEEKKVLSIIEGIFNYYCEKPDELPTSNLETAWKKMEENFSKAVAEE